MGFHPVIPTCLEEVRVADHGDAFWPANLGNHWAIIASPKQAIKKYLQHQQLSEIQKPHRLICLEEPEEQEKKKC